VTERLARQLAYVAQDLDARQYPYAGVIRQAARRLLALADEEEVAGRNQHTEAVCAGCGEPITQKATGRPRKWCGRGRCRKRGKKVS
jgi:hypothetical protein